MKWHPKEDQTIPLDIEPAVIQFEPITLALKGTVTIPTAPPAPPASAPTQRGLDAVVDLGFDPTGKEDCAPLLSGYFAGDLSHSSELHFPPGRYYFASTVETNAKLVRLIGDGQVSLMGDGAVTFCTDQALDSLLWFNCTTTGSNMEGPRLENIQFQDVSSGHNQLRSALRITNTANTELKIGFRNLRPQRYTAGTVQVSSQSKEIVGTGTAWKGSMAPGWIVVGGYPYEVVSVNSKTSLTLAIAYQGVSGSGLAYGLNWGGVGVWVQPGLGWTQYGKDWSLVGRCGCALFASTGTGATGTSRIKVHSGYVNGESMPDSMACYLGPFSDTFIFDVAMNSYAFGVVVASGHQHDLQHADYENAGPAPPVSGMPAGYNSARGLLIMGDSASNTWGNRIGGYFRQIGTAIELYGAPGCAPNYTVIGACTFRSNKVNYVPGNATNTIGAEVYLKTARWDGDPPPCDE